MRVAFLDELNAISSVVGFENPRLSVGRYSKTQGVVSKPRALTYQILYRVSGRYRAACARCLALIATTLELAVQRDELEYLIIYLTVCIEILHKALIACIDSSTVSVNSSISAQLTLSNDFSLLWY